MNMAEITKKISENEMLIQQLMSQSRMASTQDASIAEYEACQQRADQALQPFARRAGPPLLGEPIMSYRRRLAGEVQKHAPKWKDFPLAGVRVDAFECTIEAQIYADAAAAPLLVPPGELVCVPKTGYGGHHINEYFGSPDAWMRAFAPPVRQFVSAFNDKKVA
jgi:hypothetical protein